MNENLQVTCSCGVKFSLATPEVEVTSGLRNDVVVGHHRELAICPNCHAEGVLFMVQVQATWGVRPLNEGEKAALMRETAIVVPKLVVGNGLERNN